MLSADGIAVACSIEGMMCARLFTKGAAEQILELCTRRIRDDSGVALLGPDEKQHILDSFSRDGNRCARCCYGISFFFILWTALCKDVTAGTASETYCEHSVTPTDSGSSGTAQLRMHDHAYILVV